jgi:hypothetical protein
LNDRIREEMSKFHKGLKWNSKKGANSARTSISQVAAGLKKIKELGVAKDGDTNLDWGGGKYDKGTEYLKKQCIINLVYDPFNRSPEHNASVLKTKADSGTLLNVLNVIPEKDERIDTIKQMMKYIKNDGKILVGIYNKNNSKKLEHTGSGWQNNQPLTFYKDELEEAGYKISKKGGYLVVEK